MAISTTSQTFAYSINLYGYSYYLAPTRNLGGWTDLSDSLIVNGYTDTGTTTQPLALGGIYLDPSTTVYTLGGDDTISSILAFDYSKGSRLNFSSGVSAIQLRGTLYMGSGKDIVSGSVSFISSSSSIYPNGALYGYYNSGGRIYTGADGDIIRGSVTVNIPSASTVSAEQCGVFVQGGTISMDAGDDLLEGSITFVSQINGRGISYGIKNSATSKILMGDGSDIIRSTVTVAATSTKTVRGIINFGIIDLGIGNNTIIASNGTMQSWIENAAGASILSGDGSDTITSQTIGTTRGYIKNDGTISLGGGNDQINGVINNTGLIDMGAGDDSIVGSAQGGKILLGAGNDYIIGSARTGVDFGDGDDKLICSGNSNSIGVINGGNGIDTLLLKQGAYQISTNSTTYTVTPLTSTGALDTINSLTANNFEVIGSSVNGGSSYSSLNGKFFFNANGTVTTLA